MADKVQHDFLTLSGKTDEFEPRFTFRGFRFAEITGITSEQARSLDITFILFSNGFASAGSFLCDDDRINNLQQYHATLNTDEEYSSSQLQEIMKENPFIKSIERCDEG